MKKEPQTLSNAQWQMWKNVWKYGAIKKGWKNKCKILKTTEEVIGRPKQKSKQRDWYDRDCEAKGARKDLMGKYEREQEKTIK